MNLLFKVIYAHGARSTHHKLALDALRQLESPDAERWQRLLLKLHEPYLKGAKAPDTVFKDFRNHVLHVSQNNWGGAPKAAREWYTLLVDSLRKENWEKAAYVAGVVSHYYTDPLMPFHTGQTKAESNIHRAAEWSCTKTYNELRAQNEEQGSTFEPVVGDGDDWLEQMVLDGAKRSHAHYQTFIDEYNFDRGKKDPPAGLNEICREFLADLLGFATAGFARILDRAFLEAGVTPPKVLLTLDGVLAGLTIPIRWITNKLADSRDRKQVLAIYDELQRTGTVEENLPEDDRLIRDAVAKEVPKTHREKPAATTEPRPKNSRLKPVLAEPKPRKREAVAERKSEPGNAKTEHNAIIEMPAAETSPKLKFRLAQDDPVQQAPSIGKKTAGRLRKAGIKTVRDLLKCDPDAVAANVGVNYITPKVVTDWRDQANLVCRVPNLYGHDAQILVACDVRDAETLAAANGKELLAKAITFCHSSEGERVLRGANRPDADEIRNWIDWAQQNRPLAAA